MSPSSVHKQSTRPYTPVRKSANTNIFVTSLPTKIKLKVPDNAPQELTQSIDTDSGRWEQASVASSKMEEIMDSLKLLEKDEEFPQSQSKGTLLGDVSNQEMEDKLNKVILFLNESDKNERLGQLGDELAKRNEHLHQEITSSTIHESNLRMEQASHTASELSAYLARQQRDNEEKESLIDTLRQTLENQKAMFAKHKEQYKLEMIKSMESHKNEDENKINSHLSFIDKLIDDKKKLAARCDQLVTQLRVVEDKYSRKISVITENYKLETTKLTEKHEISEKLRQERWIAEKTEKIKEITIKGLEPEIKKLIAKQKQEIKTLKQVHDAELRGIEDRVSQRYAKLTEDLREQLSLEKEAACARERELAKRSYEKQYENELLASEKYKGKLLEQVGEEKSRLDSQYRDMKDELDVQRREIMTDHVKAIELLRKEYEKAQSDQQSRHEVEMRCVEERVKMEKEVWTQNMMNQRESKLIDCERKIRERARQERDQQIELAIAKLEEETRKQLHENEKTAENRISRMRDRYEAAQSELETSEKNTMSKYTELKGVYYEQENKCERLRASLNQKDYEIEERERKLEIFSAEKDRLAQVIRQEFIERMVRTDEDNKRLMNEKSEVSTKAKLDIERIRAANDVALQMKEDELQQVHDMVKKALEKRDQVVSSLKAQYEAAERRADHLESLLLQQKKDFLNK